MLGKRRTVPARAASVVAAAIVLVTGGGAVAGAVASSPHRSRVAGIRLSVDRSSRNGNHVAAAGKVTSVNGVTTTGHCGTAGKTGTFALENPKTTKSLTVHVTTTTKFVEPYTTASFADVCVGKSVSVAGVVASETFYAATVNVVTPG
jgi:hypothetical protein